MITSAGISRSFTRSRGWLSLAAVLTVAVIATGCAESPTGPTHYSAFIKTDVVVGTGDEATLGKSLTVNYTGWLYDASKSNLRGAQFDSSVGRTPFTFVLGSNQVIQGWDQGLLGMLTGGVRQLTIPPSLAYGGTRRGQIPPNATLIFEIELLSVQ